MEIAILGTMEPLEDNRDQSGYQEIVCANSSCRWCESNICMATMVKINEQGVCVVD